VKRLERISADAWAPVGLHLGLQAEEVLADAMASLLLGVCLVSLGRLLSTPTLWVSFLAISVAIFSVVAFDSTVTHIVFSWAIFPFTMYFVATVATVVWGHEDLVQALLVGGDASHHLLAGVQDPLGPLGCLTSHCLCDCLWQRHVLLGEEVLLQLHVFDPIDEQAEDDRLAVVERGLAGQVGAGEPYVALSGLGLEAGEEVWNGLAWLLPDSVEFVVLACTVCLVTQQAMMFSKIPCSERFLISAPRLL
jgi:hypothetical protein